MRILIVDDTKENLEAAKQASMNFPEHEFLFTEFAGEAATKLPGADAIITDLFFPDEKHNDFDDFSKEDLALSYNNFYGMLGITHHKPAFEEVVQKYYHNDLMKAEDKQLEVLDLVSEGTIRGALVNLIRDLKKQGQDVAELLERLNNLPAPQFPYGAGLMLQAKELGKSHCLVSDIHRHAGSYKDAPSAIDAMALPLPLMDADIISVEQTMYDGEKSLTFLGSDEIHRYGKGKNDPVVWTEAIRRIIQQKGGEK